MKQRRYARRTEPEDPGIAPPDGPVKQLSTDVIVIAKDHKDTARTSQTGCTTIHTIRDAFSGVGLAIPTLQHTKDVMYTNLKFFGGLVGDRSPGILVKSDAALSLTGAIHDLGWHAEPSLENRWPHNTAHERYHAHTKAPPEHHCPWRHGIWR